MDVPLDATGQLELLALGQPSTLVVEEDPCLNTG